MKEQWKPVVGFEGFYEVSDCGRVRSVPRNGTRKHGTVLKAATDKNGYRRVVLAVYGKNLNKKVARLVAEAFIPNPESKPTVDHDDFNRANDVVTNLKWATQSEQMQRVFDAGRMKLAPHIGAKGSKHLMAKLGTSLVRRIRKEYAAGKGSQSSLAEKYGVTQGMVGYIVRGKAWTHVDGPLTFNSNHARLGNQNARGGKMKQKGFSLIELN